MKLDRDGKKEGVWRKWEIMNKGLLRKRKKGREENMIDLTRDVCLKI